MTGAGKTDADARRQSETHGSETSRVKDTLPGAPWECQQEHLDSSAGTAGNDQILGMCVLGDDFCQVIHADAARSAALWSHERITILPFIAARLPVDAVRAVYR